MAGEDSTFFTRWSRRKALARTGEELPEPAPSPPAEVLPAAAVIRAPTMAATGAPTVAPAAPATPAAEAPPALTLQDVAQLTRESDYAGFVARDVAPEVRNAALKKLFTDPHFNVMDGLDTYIDDYSQPDPLPPGMLRQMVQSKMLGLFDEEDAAEAQALAAAEALAESEPEPVPAEGTPPDPAPAPPAAAAPTALPADTATHEDPALQLQPDDDAGRACPEPGAGQDAGRQH